LSPKEGNVRERAEEEEQQRAEAPHSAGIENNLPERHRQCEHRHQQHDAQQVKAPHRIEPEEFKIARLKVEVVVLTDTVAREVRILRWKVMPNGEALHDRSVWPEVAVLGIGNLQPTATGIEGGKHHPGDQDHVSGD